MRDYGKVSPQFWIGPTGKALRGDAHAQLLALYLMTSPHSNMVGVFHCPVLYMAHETGIPLEGASEALLRLIEAGFCTYEWDSETVFVHRMAAYQVGEALSPKDNQVKGIQKDYEKMAPALIKQAFYAIYSVAFHLPPSDENQRKTEAPCKPLASQEQEQEQEQDKEPYGSVGRADHQASPQPAQNPPKPELPRCDVQAVVALYHEALPELPAVRLMTDQRRRAVAAFWRFVLTSKRSDGTPRATTAADALAWIGGYFARARDNDFLMGRGGRAAGHENWQCDFDFLLSEKGKKHVIEKTQAVAA